MIINDHKDQDMKTKNQNLFQGRNMPLFKKTRYKIIKNNIEKSTAMKYAQIYQKAAAVAIVMILMSAVANAGDATINGTMANTGRFIVKGALTGSLKNIGGTVEFGKNGDQTIPSGYTFEKLECTTGGNKTFAGTVTVTDYVKADAANVKISTYKLILTSANANLIQTANVGTIDFTSGEVEYARNGIQTVYGATYKNLTIGSGGDKTANTNVQVTGALTVNDNLVMNGTSVLIMKDGASQPTFASLKEVYGSMTWEAFNAQAYTFNNSDAVLTFSGADAARTVTLISQPGANPTGYLASRSVNRKFNVSYSNWTNGTVDVKLSYLQGEASTLGVTEAQLEDYKNGIVSANKLSGTPTRTTSSATSFGSVKYLGLTSLQLTTPSELAMDDRFYSGPPPPPPPPPPPTGFVSVLNAAWNIGTTWQGGVVPGASDNAIINTAVTIQDGGTYSVKSITINSGAAISLQIGGTGSGQLNVGTGGVANNNAANANALDIRENGILEIVGTLTNNGGISNAGRITVQ